MSIPSPTGSRIRERRIMVAMKQSHLARDAGISASYLNLIEHNRRPIGGALLGRLAEALGVDQSALSSDTDSALADTLRTAGAAQGLSGESLTDASDLARRYPEWAEVIAAQSETLATQARTIEALSDRLTNDPSLADAMHELLSTVSVVRSTASILAQTPEIDANWLHRFHTNLDADSRRLAEGAEAVVSYFDEKAAGGPDRLTPSEVVAAFLDAHNHHFDAIEAEGADAVETLVQQVEGEAARAMARDVLMSDARDAARLPLALMEGAAAPDDLLDAAGGDAALVLRRMGCTDPARGLVICDAAGAILRRKSVAGFGLPVVGAGCPLWPIYTALTQPGRPSVERIEMPDGARWDAHAVATADGARRFDEAMPVRATMLLTRAGISGRARPVGSACRVCSRETCAARREPSVLTGPPRAATLPTGTEAAEAGQVGGEGGTVTLRDP